MPKCSVSVTDEQNGESPVDTRDYPSVGSLEAQLRDLYAQRQELQRALGTADSKAIIAMVRSLERQLVDLYGLLRGQRDHLPQFDFNPPETSSQSD